jgi:hypothetical protein
MPDYSRRDVLKSLAVLGAGAVLPAVRASTKAESSTEVEVLSPAGRVPLSFVIDDSTCLVNMGHFCTPQFAAAFPDRAQYQRPWKEWPREIPDSFVREFGEWCAEHGVKGKYSIVPNPACVGYLDRELPGWSHRELQDSLKLVRELMVPNWDIHPEMITHTRVIDLKTGRPKPEIGPATIENSYPQKKQSVDELAAYMAYALRILKNCDLPCEGITTPGGFGNIMKPELSLAVQQAVNDVYAPEIVHYFKYIHGGDQSTDPILEHVQGVGTDQLSFTANVPAGTGDWFGGWQGVDPSQGSKYCNEDATAGRMVELIEQNKPAVMLCHWPGMYCNGSKEGFHDFQKIVLNLQKRFGDRTIWMKLSEMARYKAAQEFTTIRKEANHVQLDAPFSAANFTLRIPKATPESPLILRHEQQQTKLHRVPTRQGLAVNTWYQDQDAVIACIDLPKGESRLTL